MHQAEHKCSNPDGDVLVAGLLYNGLREHSAKKYLFSKAGEDAHGEYQRK